MSVWIRKRPRKASPREPRGGWSYIVLYRRGGRAFPVESAGTFRKLREARLRQQVVGEWLAKGKNPRDELAKLTGAVGVPVRRSARAHVLSASTPYGNLLALRELIRAGRGAIRWWDPHLPRRALEVLYDELDGTKVKQVRLLSGPANVNDRARKDFERFQHEMRAARGIDAQWRVLAKEEARKHHDRFFITGKLSRNLPPFNTILGGGTGEILPSKVTRAEFDEWWESGTALADFVADNSA